jgi:cation diffusion facilitator family transporter
MSSHAVAIGLSAFAYAAARRHATDARYAFGTWKIEVLGGFASALFLLGVAGWMVFGSLERLLSPGPIRYLQAMEVALVGLVVNLACALILGKAHHDHGHDGHHHHDLNLRSAYLHVLADAATSVLAIGALAGGLCFGWAWLDPLMGLAGALLVGTWAWGLIRDTTRILLDREMDHPVVAEVSRVLGSQPEWGRRHPDHRPACMAGGEAPFRLHRGPGNP